MVRTTIACAWCRRSKIKCIHEGTPPCRNCLKSKREECVLSGPFEPGQPSRVIKERSARPTYSQRTRLAIEGLRNAGRDVSSPNSCSGDNLREKQDRAKEIILALDPQSVFEVAMIFHLKFPELAFLHLPTFQEEWKDGGRNWVLIAAMFALCSRLVPRCNKPKLISEDQFASCSRIGLQSALNGPPSLPVVQVLLIMSMYEWGSGNGHGAWMHSGMAIRMMQSLDSTRQTPSVRDLSGEIYNRTFWSCFVMDRFIFCGKSQPLALPVAAMKIDVPSGEQGFTFGSSGRSKPSFDSGGPFTVNEYYIVLIKGFDIWAKILDLIVSGGRRKPNMSKPENCPWVIGSPWKSLLDRLEEWRSQQSDQLKFPTTSVAAHVSLGSSEKFAYVNLLYYVCVLFLNREYIPFLPIQISEPVGPIDPPLLEGTAPPGWWQDRAKDLFDAAEYITSMHQQLELLNSSLYTPFSAFCSFCAGSMNGYVTSFPQMNLDRSLNSAANEELNFLYLEKFKRLWKIGDGWMQTLKRVQSLRICASQDPTRFHGKGRSDFIAMDESIHDYSGATPPVRSEAESVKRPLVSAIQVRGFSDDTSATCPENNGDTFSHQDQPPTCEATPDAHHTEGGLFGIEDWDEIWPMWGDQQFPPFETDGMAYRFDMDPSPI